MKRFSITALLLLCAAGLLSAAGKKAAPDNGKINVIASIFPAYDFARQIAGNRINLGLLLPPGAESHSFEPAPRDIIAIKNSDVFIYIGGESDAWVDRILESMDTGKMKIVRLMDTVELVEEEIVEGMEDDEHGHEDDDDGHDHEGDDDEAAYDEHIWTAPQNAARIVEAIGEALCERDAANAAHYRKNSADYREKLKALDEAFKKAAAGAKRKTIVFGDRFPFRYFADAYGLSYFAAFPGCSTETEPSAATIAFLINKIKAEKIPVIFHIELSNERMADTIAAETGAKKRLLHAVHNISKRDFDRGLGYLDFMQANIKTLEEALR